MKTSIKILCLCGALAVISAVLPACAGGFVRPREPGGKESHPLESFPDTNFETINPLEENKLVTVASPSRGTIITPVAEQAARPALDSVAIEDELLRLINLSRGESGLAMLESEETILWAARLRSAELQSEFNHTRPDGSAYYTVFDEVGYSYSGKWHGENASTVSFPGGSYTEAEIAAFMFEDLAGSPGHLKNMQRSQYDLVGIGVSIQTEDGKTIVTSSQLFSSK